MSEQKTKQKRVHNLFLNNREKLELSGVYDVESFDEKTVICFTDYGQLIVKGNALHVDNMDVTGGNMQITGEISGLIYTAEKRQNGIFSKLFK